MSEEKRESLRSILLLEHRFNYLKTFMAAPSLKGSFIKLEQAIPCIMHCENHAGERMLYMLIVVSLDQRQTNTEHDMLIDHCMFLVNCHVLGSEDNPYQYKMPDEDGELQEIRFHNWCMRKIMDHFGEFIDCCLLDENDRVKWRNVERK